MKNKNIEIAIKKVVAALREGNIKDIAYATFHSKKDKPSDNWSFLNYLMMVLSGTDDARGYNQWKKCGRYVKKGSKAIHILAPITFKKTVTMVTEAGGEEEVEKSVRWFKNVPVFAIEDTDGEPLPETETFELKVPVNLLQVSEELGLTVNAKGFYRDTFGYFSQARKEIALMSPELSVYLHELGHAVDDKINGTLKGGQHSDQEVVAELSAEVVMYLMGYKLNGKSKKYIDHYTDKDWRLVFKLLNRVNKVVSYIAEHAEIKADAEVETVETFLFGKKAKTEEEEVKAKLDMLQAAEVAAAIGA